MPRVSTKTKAPVEFQVPQVVQVPTPVVSDVEETVKKTVRRKPREVSLDELNSEYDRVLQSVTEQINVIKLGDGGKRQANNPHIKYLKTLEKDIKTLKTSSAKALRTKQKVKRETNVRSGFMKPVRISPEMAKFTGWDPSKECSRVDVTKFICKYVKDHNLQNQNDKRKINPDDKLCKLLRCSKNEGDLSYCTLQKFIQPHFMKVASE